MKSTIQILPIIPTTAESENYVQIQQPEVKPNVDQDVRKIHTASVRAVGNDPIFANNVLPLPTVLHGILTFLILKNFARYVCLTLLLQFFTFASFHSNHKFDGI